ncbi:hypothetical protein HDU81_008242 [Chytriomyces hyalinus]|nr:hypothetical protein HDU81_008242 [Chytriomyces hyalinus]
MIFPRFTVRALLRLLRIATVAAVTALTLLAAATLAMRLFSSTFRKPQNPIHSMSTKSLDFICKPDLDYPTYQQSPLLNENEVFRMMGRREFAKSDSEKDDMPYIAFVPGSDRAGIHLRKRNDADHADKLNSQDQRNVRDSSNQIGEYGKALVKDDIAKVMPLKKNFNDADSTDGSAGDALPEKGAYSPVHGNPKSGKNGDSQYLANLDSKMKAKGGVEFGKEPVYDDGSLNKNRKKGDGVKDDSNVAVKKGPVGKADPHNPADEGLKEGVWIPFGSVDPKEEEKMMEWHGFGKEDEKEDNSDNAWKEWAPSKGKGADTSYDTMWVPFSQAPTKLINYSHVILEPWKSEASFHNTPRITYFNGHRGCNENLRGVLAKFRLNFNVLDPRKLTNYGMGEADARLLVESKWVKALCNHSDVIIVADTVPDARGILLSLLEKDEAKRCTSKVVVEMTNRFDWMVGDSRQYYDMLRKLVQSPPPNLFWTANNPFEEAFFRTQVGMSPNVTLLRSMGAWDVDTQIKTEKTIMSRIFEAAGLNRNELRWRKQIDHQAQESLCTIKNTEITTRPLVGDLMDYYCMPIVQLSKKYGGPVGLLKFKGFVHFPYQVSVMKFYENVAMGVPQVIPTARLLRAVSRTNNHHLFSTWLDKLEESSLYLFNPDYHDRVYDHEHNPRDWTGLNDIDRPYHATWTELSDFHKKEFQPFVYYFDSFAELAELVKLPYDKFDWKNVRTEGPKYYAKVRRQSIDTYKSLFHAMGYTKVREYFD